MNSVSDVEPCGEGGLIVGEVLNSSNVEDVKTVVVVLRGLFATAYSGMGAHDNLV